MSSRLTRGLARSASEIELDEHLHELGFWRKMIPKDGNCLFRIASEKLLGSQIFYEVIRELFESYHLHQRKLKVPESTSLFQFLSHLMKKDIKIFWNSSSEMRDCTSNNFDEKMILCTVDDKHFDLVYTLDYVNTSALCQSVLYKILSKNVFGVKKPKKEKKIPTIWNCCRCKKSCMRPVVPASGPVRTNRINSTSHMMNVPTVREGHESNDIDLVEMANFYKCMQDQRTVNKTGKAKQEEEEPEGLWIYKLEQEYFAGVQFTSKRELKPSSNIVFFGPSGSGKSSIIGRLMMFYGRKSKQDLEGYKKKAKDLNRPESFLSIILDTELEQESGRTIYSKSTCMQSQDFCMHVTDSPGFHQNIQEAIMSLLEADEAYLVVPGTQFDTMQDWLMIAKATGHESLTIVQSKIKSKIDYEVEKEWKELLEENNMRLNEILPVCANDNWNIESVDCYPYLCLVEKMYQSCRKDHYYNEMIRWLGRDPDIRRSCFLHYEHCRCHPDDKQIERLRFIIHDCNEERYYVCGKIKTGWIRKSSQVLLMPGNLNLTVVRMTCMNEEIKVATKGLDVEVYFKRTNSPLQDKLILCDTLKPISCFRRFRASITILRNEGVLEDGKEAFLLLQFHRVSAVVQRVISVKGCKGSEQEKLKVKVGETAGVIILVDHKIYMDRYLDHQQFGRFVLHNFSGLLASGRVL